MQNRKDFDYSDYELKNKTTFIIYENNHTTQALNVVIKHDNITVKDSQARISTDQRTALKANHVHKQTALNSLCRMIKNKRGHVDADQAPDYFVGDNSKMCLGLYMKGKYAGLAVLSYCVGKKWQTIYGALSFSEAFDKTKNRIIGDCYTVAFYKDTPRSMQWCIDNADMKEELTDHEIFLKIKECMVSYGVSWDRANQLRELFEGEKKAA